MKKPKPFVFKVDGQKYKIDAKADIDVYITWRFLEWLTNVALWAEEKQQKKAKKGASTK